MPPPSRESLVCFSSLLYAMSTSQRAGILFEDENLKFELLRGNKFIEFNIYPGDDYPGNI
jgi:hypothetical protein